jgi:hypothetical protein
MIAPTVLDATSTAIGDPYDVIPGWSVNVSTSLAGTGLCRMVAPGDTAEHVTLATLLCIRDEAGLMVAGGHPSIIGLVEACAGSVGCAVDWLDMGGVAHARFDSGVPA